MSLEKGSIEDKFFEGSSAAAAYNKEGPGENEKVKVMVSARQIAFLKKDSLAKSFILVMCNLDTPRF